MSILQHVVLPVATVSDAERTVTALRPHLAEVESVVAVHVIEKAAGAPDKAPLAKREEEAEEVFEAVEAALGGEVTVETSIVYETDVVDAIFEAAEDDGATAVAFVAREGSRLTRILSGDTSLRLVTEATVPVVALPEEDG